jgi:hypothetical protein
MELTSRIEITAFEASDYASLGEINSLEWAQSG